VKLEQVIAKNAVVGVGVNRAATPVELEFLARSRNAVILKVHKFTSLD
jgi:hypothetical protein